MHNLMQYIPGNKLIPVDVSIFAGYTKLQGNVPLELLPETGIPQTYTSAYPSGSFDGQNLNVSVQALKREKIFRLLILKTSQG